MGEIADSMLNGEMCEGCGEYIGADNGYPMYCSEKCAKDRGADISQVVKDDDSDGDNAEYWAQHRKERREKKDRNEKASIGMLNSQGFEVQVVSAQNKHYRVGRFDFWPTTGVFYDPKTKHKDRGVRNLIRELRR